MDEIKKEGIEKAPKASSIYDNDLSHDKKQEIDALSKEAEFLAMAVADVDDENAEQTTDDNELDVDVVYKTEDAEPIEVVEPDVAVEANVEKPVENESKEVEKSVLPKQDTRAKEKNNDKKRQQILQILKYALCAASAGLIQFVSFTIFTYTIPNNLGKMTFITEMDVSLFLSTTIALLLSVLWNFTVNRKFTFKSAGNVPRAMALAFLFYVPFYPFQTWYVHAVSTAINPTAEWASLIAEATVMLINGVLEFCWQKFVIYRKEENTALKKEKKVKK